MTSLQRYSGIGKKAVIAFMITTMLALAAAAQTVPTQQQGRSYGEPGFRGEPINLNVVNADIRDILNYITEQYGINFVIDKSVQKIPVTVNVSNVPWNIALDSILRSQELGVQVNGTILRIADSKTLASEGDIFRAQQNNQLDSSPLFTEFIRLNFARAKDGLETGSTSAGTTTANSPVLGNGLPFQSGNTQNSPNFSNTSGSSTGILPIIRRRLSRRGAVEVDARSNTLIITDVRENIDAIRQLVTLLDQPEPQVEIEARIVVATRLFSRDIGVQISALVLGNGTDPAGGVFQTGSIPTPTGSGIPAAPVNGTLGTLGNTAIGLTTGVFGTVRINALITAGETSGQAKVIATPRVTTLNNRKAEIKSGIKIPVTTVQPGSAGGDSVATTEYVDIPLKLEVTPQITDVGSVILNVTAENSSLATGGISGAINTQSMQTEVTVPDGGTTVIGGVLSDNETEGVNRTPGLSRIPFLGNLLKRKNVARNTAEILFFITPRIYRPELSSGSSNGMERPKSTTIVQPVPLGNPASNSDTTPVTPFPNPLNPVVPTPVPSGTPKQ